MWTEVVEHNFVLSFKQNQMKRIETENERLNR